MMMTDDFNERTDVLRVSTWADGFGRWHAEVRFTRPLPASTARASEVRAIARKRIRDELTARNNIGKGWRCRVAEVRADAAGPGLVGRIEYAETD